MVGLGARGRFPVGVEGAVGAVNCDPCDGVSGGDWAIAGGGRVKIRTMAISAMRAARGHIQPGSRERAKGCHLDSPTDN